MSDQNSFSFDQLAGGLAATVAPVATIQAPAPVQAPTPQAPVAAVETFTARYVGTYYKPHGDFVKKMPYDVTVKLPTAWLNRKDYNPQGFFIKFVAPTVLANAHPDFSKVAICKLAETSGLPENLPNEAFLAWTADREKLADFARRADLPVKAELYPDADALRRAIIRCKQCMTEEGGKIDTFLKEQDRLLSGKAKATREIMSEFLSIEQ